MKILFETNPWESGLEAKIDPNGTFFLMIHFPHSPDMKFIEYGMNKISIIFTCRDQKELTLVLLHAGISCLLSTDDITNPSGDKHSLFIDV